MALSCCQMLAWLVRATKKGQYGTGLLLILPRQSLSDGDVFVQVNILDRIEQGRAF